MTMTRLLFLLLALAETYTAGDDEPPEDWNQDDPQ